MTENNSLYKLFNNGSICVSFKTEKKEKIVSFFKSSSKSNNNGFLSYTFSKMCSVSLYRLALQIRNNCTDEKYSKAYEKFKNTGFDEDFIFNNENDVFIDNLIFGTNELFFNVTEQTNLFINDLSLNTRNVTKSLFFCEDNSVLGNCQLNVYPCIDDDKSIFYIHIFDNLLSFYCFILYKYYIEENRQIFKYCKFCGKKFTPKKRSDTIYCSENCRKKAFSPKINHIHHIYKNFRDFKKRYIRYEDTDLLRQWAKEIYDIRILCEEITRPNISPSERYECLEKLKKIGYVIPTNNNNYEMVDELFAYRNKNKKQIMLSGEPTDEDVEKWFYKYIRDEWYRIFGNEKS